MLERVHRGLDVRGLGDQLRVRDAVRLEVLEVDAEEMPGGSLYASPAYDSISEKLGGHVAQLPLPISTLPLSAPISFGMSKTETPVARRSLSDSMKSCWRATR